MRLRSLPLTKLPSVSRTRAAISRRAASSSTFTRRSAAKFASDFDHHAPGIARLNHGSFGATPAPVLAATEACRARWLAQPDEDYFSGALDADLQEATAAAADAIGAPAEETSLVENATVAAAIVFRRWCQLDGTVLLPANAYGGVKASALAAFGPQRVKEWPFPFPGTTHAHILDWLDQALKQHDPRYVIIDHVSSQPAVVCPVAEMVALCRRRGVAEVAVDGAHALGQVPINVDAIGADYFFSNLHKWAFAAPTATILHSLRGLRHVVPSWGAGDFAAECRWTGTRDYAAMRAVPAALAYLRDWRSLDGLATPEFNRVGLRRAVDELSAAWSVDAPYHEECLGSMGMVRLPAGLDLSRDVPGQPVGPDSVRSRLRDGLCDGYGVEAAVGGFPDGGFLRLSHAVYTSDDDLERLRDAVLELV
ncbi:unnamed protein product [Pelagomonas calceolata]|uniref:Aminotransferase class V domain-containing protein n=1 Tax=Pelagomonas calceolata TaxID=35677 RepID=A0A8J2WUZ8_9STRA|nr:unnamed protein product [Pelagomonas calceolata]